MSTGLQEFGLQNRSAPEKEGREEGLEEKLNYF
jgi:hypothetical protein